MLQINLSTRPFYNERGVHVALGAVGVLVLALTTFNVTQVVTLSGRHRALTTRADQVEATADDVARQTLTIQRNLDRDELEVADANVRAANRSSTSGVAAIRSVKAAAGRGSIDSTRVPSRSSRPRRTDPGSPSRLG